MENLQKVEEIIQQVCEGFCDDELLKFEFNRCNLLNYPIFLNNNSVHSVRKYDKIIVTIISYGKKQHSKQ